MNPRNKIHEDIINTYVKLFPKIIYNEEKTNIIKKLIYCNFPCVNIFNHSSNLNKINDSTKNIQLKYFYIYIIYILNNKDLNKYFEFNILKNYYMNEIDDIKTFKNNILYFINKYEKYNSYYELELESKNKIKDFYKFLILYTINIINYNNTFLIIEFINIKKIKSILKILSNLIIFYNKYFDDNIPFNFIRYITNIYYKIKIIINSSMNINDNIIKYINKIKIIIQLHKFNYLLKYEFIKLISLYFLYKI